MQHIANMRHQQANRTMHNNYSVIYNNENSPRTNINLSLEVVNGDIRETSCKWTGLFSKSLNSLGMNLLYIPKEIKNNVLIANLKAHEVYKMEQNWDNLAMLFFMIKVWMCRIFRDTRSHNGH